MSTLATIAATHTAKEIPMGLSDVKNILCHQKFS